MTETFPGMRPAAFMHIAKTAGTSVQVMARHAYGNDNVISHADFAALGLERCRRIPFVSGHFGHAFLKALGPDRYTFTFLRNPVERLLSLYRFCRSRPASENPLYAIAQSVDLHGFLEPVHGDLHFRKVWNTQTYCLFEGFGAELVGLNGVPPWEVPERRLVNTAIGHLADFDHVGLQETFEDDIRAIFAALGDPVAKPLCLNVSDPDPTLTDLPLRTRRRLREVTALDQLLYQHVVETHPAGGVVPAGRRLEHRIRRSLLSPLPRLLRPITVT